MKIVIGVPVYNSVEYLRKLIETSFLDSDRHDILLMIFTHSNNPGSLKVISDRLDDHPIQLYDFQANRGVAKTWNDIQINAFARENADVCIICNDDIYFSPGDVDKIAQKAAANRENYIVSMAGYHEGLDVQRVTHGYSCYAINPISLEMVGCFDENFWPAYGEDLDHHRRATMLGLVETNCPDTSVVHGGSQTISRDEMLSLSNMVTQNRNLAYFRIKWNSDSHEGGYRFPFDNPDFGLKIEIKDRACPYPGYNRKDLGGLQ